VFDAQQFQQSFGTV